MRLARCVLALVTVWLAGCQAAFMRSLKVPYALSDYQKTTIAYGNHRDQRMDVYQPSEKKFGNQPKPVIVFFFGGSWRSGERAWYEFFAAHYTNKGYVVVVPDYRKAPEFVYPSFMQDAASAAAHTLASAEKFNADPNHVILMGHSAGAHMAALLCVDTQFLAAHGLDARVFSAFVGLSGPYDFLPMTDPLVIEVFRGDANLAESQPVHFARNILHTPPVLLVHGATDRLVWPKNARNFAGAINARGGNAQVLMLENVGHVGTLFQAARGLRWMAKDVDSAVDRFLMQLKKP
jgi:acetyl esterase/lipase